MNTKTKILSGILMIALISIAVGLGNEEVVAVGGNLILNSTSDIVLDPDGNDILPGSDSSENFGATANRWLTSYFDAVDTPVIDAVAGLELQPVGDITLDPAGNDVLPGSDSADTFGASGTRWLAGYFDDVDSSTVDTPVIEDGSTISVKCSGDTDDYLQFITTADEPAIKVIGGDHYRIINDQVSTGYTEFRTSSGTAGTRLSLQSKDGNTTYLYMYNSDHGTHPADTVLWNDEEQGEIKIIPNNDASDYAIFSTAANVISVTPNTDGEGTLGTDALTWADVKSVLIQGSDICLANDWCFTECSNNGENDVCVVTQKPTKLMAQKMALYKFETFEEYQASHMIPFCLIPEDDETCHMVYDETLTESEFLLYRAEIYTDGKLDFLFGRTNKGSLRDLKGMLDLQADYDSAVARQMELIQILYDNGGITGQQAQHLRDDF